MDVNGPDWEAYERLFQQLAERSQPWHGPKPSLADTRHYLCLYGENGFTPAEEFELLTAMARDQPLYRLEIETAYWQEIILFSPKT